MPTSPSKEQFEDVFFPGVEKCTIRILPGAVDIVKLQVEKENRGKGIGSQVIDNLKKRFHDKFLCVVPVAIDDPADQLRVEMFYLKNGFVWDTGLKGESLECMSWKAGRPHSYRHRK